METTTQGRWRVVARGALVVGGLALVAPTVYSQGIGLKRFEEMQVSTPQKVARGKALYGLHCASCHGDQGKGDGPTSQASGRNPGDFTDGAYKYGGGLISLYNFISKKQKVEVIKTEGETPPASPDGSEPKPQPTVEYRTVNHPIYGYLAYQDRWAIAHFVKSLHRGGPVADPAEVIKQAKVEAVEGTCDPEIKGTIAAKVNPADMSAVLKKGNELYAINCVSCHGEQGKGNGPASQGMNPVPRNFHSMDQKWYRGTSPLQVFNTLTLGARGSMASYTTLSEEERWALTHYISQWVPEKRRKKVTDKDLVQVCKSLSTPAKPRSVPINMAMKFLVEDQPEKRAIRHRGYGVVLLAPKFNVKRGEDIYTANCISCHGAGGQGVKAKGPYGSYPPYLYVNVRRLVPASAGGNAMQFARRSLGGVHRTMAELAGSAALSDQDWKDLQSYVSNFEGPGEIAKLPEPAPIEEVPEGGVEQPSPEGGDPEQPAPEKKDEEAPKKVEETTTPAPATP